MGTNASLTKDNATHRYLIPSPFPHRLLAGPLGGLGQVGGVKGDHCNQGTVVTPGARPLAPW
jgi:hypothetical protein